MYSPTTQRHCPWSHLTVELDGRCNAASDAEVMQQAIAALGPPVAAVMTAIANRELLRQRGGELSGPSDPEFDALMALKCDLIDVEAAVPWEVRVLWDALSPVFAPRMYCCGLVGRPIRELH